MAKKAKEMLLYKGKPLLRCDDKIYYGDFSENFIVVFTINDKKQIKDLSVATNVTIELLEKRGADIKSARLVKKAERQSLYAAMDIGCFWLEDILEMEKEFLAKQA